jgi:hypothetical protein
VPGEPFESQLSDLEHAGSAIRFEDKGDHFGEDVIELTALVGIRALLAVSTGDERVLKAA